MDREKELQAEIKDLKKENEELKKWKLEREIELVHLNSISRNLT